MSNTSDLKVGGKAVSIEQTTKYPWNGDINIGINKNSAGPFNLKVRIPGWVRGQVGPSDLYTYSDGKRSVSTAVGKRVIRWKYTSTWNRVP